MDLVLGGGGLDRVVQNAEERLIGYREDIGTVYLDHQPRTPPDELLLEDLSVTLLMNSRAGWRACKSVLEKGPLLQLSDLPQQSLEDTTEEDRLLVARLIAQVADWKGFGASTATKTLHKKRPALIPILDNQAIFGAYMNPDWPASPALQVTIRDLGRIKDALDRIAHDLVRRENHATWHQLRTMEPSRSLIELFDSVWWMEFRRLEPA